MALKAIDLFCGAGGLTCGLRQAGIDVVAGFDLDEKCKFAYESNNKAKFIQKKIQDVKAEDLNIEYGTCEAKVLVGCAPCQPFSSHTKKYNKGNSTPTDERWFLINDYLRLVKEVKPDIVSMENVPNLAKQEIFHSFVNKLKRAGYSVSYSVVFCPDYGVPQNRYRLVLLASKLGNISLILPTHNKNNYATVRDAIGDLKPIAAGKTDKDDPLHRSTALTPLNLKRIQATPYGGSWHDWPEELVLDCHKKKEGKTYGSVYGRMEWDKPSPTMTTQCTGLGNGRFGHPEQDRAISIREAALLQTFPKTYKFFQDERTISITTASRYIGNAVPPKLGEVIAQSIINHLNSIYHDKEKKEIK